MRQTGPVGMFHKETPSLTSKEQRVFKESGLETGYCVEEEEEDDCDDIIRSINSLLDKGKLYNRIL